MYKLLLCWRYLRTRYLALVCIISVMLGVATLIVVNSVMSGFSTKLRARLHDMLADVTLDAVDFNGMDDAEGKMARISSDPFLGPRVEAMTPTLDIFAMLQYRVGPEQAPFARPVRIIGVDPEGRKRVGGFAQFLVRPDNREHPSFRLTEEAALRYQWEQFADRRDQAPIEFDPLPKDRSGEPPPPRRPWERRDLPAAEMPPGIILGYAIAHYHDPSIKPGQPSRDVRILQPGDTVVVTTLGGTGLAPVYGRCIVADYSRTEMSDYDANYVFVPLDYLQKLRHMEDRVTSIQLRLRDYGEAKAVVEHLQELYPNLQVSTWEHKQGPLLAAISVEKGILNVLLFMIIGVAGFGILAIFSMIVVEKTRDIGILKALGASNWGVLKIFLGYGLLLGLVGAVLGSVLGLSFTVYINEIEKGLTQLTGSEIFDRNVYYFDKIPTDVQLGTVTMINLGAVGIAVLFSVLPALRAALLHPVRALRYE